MKYDIIGDIHGQYDKLINLLEKLGYQDNGKFYQAPPNHQAIFVGDFIDRNPKQVEVLNTVFAMLDNGQAHAIMGNHELNAIAYTILGDDGKYLRPHSERNTKQHQVFLDALPFDNHEHRYWIKRFYELPLWLEFDEFFVIHACADTNAMAVLSPYLNNNKLTPSTIKEIYQNPMTFHALEVLLKGVEVKVPEPYFLIDPQGIKRNNVRIAWWQENLNQPLLKMSCSSTCDMRGIPDDFYMPIAFEHTIQKPIFIGHYWLDGDYKMLSPKVVCTDYCAGRGDKLVAYRFDTNQTILNNANFISSDF